MGKFLQGVFKPKNPKKYKGNVNNIIYRSSWELKYLMKLDNDENVLQYSSEEVIIPYYFGNKLRRYFMDFWVKKKTNEGIKEFLIEIKPASQVAPPKPMGNRKKKTVIREAITYETNQAKWKAARVYCEKKGWDFQILTEHELGIPQRKNGSKK